MEVSGGFVWADVDAANQGNGLSAMANGDVFASSVLTTNIRNTVSGLEGVSGTVYESSGGWGTAGDVPSDVSGRWDSAYGSVSSTTDGSAYWVSAYNYSLCAWDTVSATSATWNESTGASAVGFKDWQGTYTNVKNTSGDWTAVITNLSPVSANIATNTASISDNADNIAVVGAVSASIGSFAGSATASAIYVGVPAGSAIDISGTHTGDTIINTVGNNYVLSIDEAAGRAKWTSPVFVPGPGGDIDNPVLFEGEATLSLGAAAMLIRNINIGNSLSAGPDCDGILDGSVIASSLSVINSLSAGPDCDLVFSNNVTIENTSATPPSNPIALVLKTIDSSPANDTNIGEIRFAGNNDAPANKVYNRLRGVADDVGAGSEDGSIELRHLTAGSEVVSLTANGIGVTVEESLTVSTCPVPAPVCYAQMDGDGTAAASETKFGAGVTPSTETDSTGHITWDNTNKEFDISVAGVYHVLATLVIYVAASTLPTIRIKNGATTKNSYTAHGVHSAERPEEVTIQAVFPCAASDSLTVTFQDDAATNINLQAGSSVIVRRLF